ncbi:Pectate lyase superfamily protein [compost metagenome]
MTAANSAITLAQQYATDAGESAAEAVAVIASLLPSDGATKVGTPEGTVQISLNLRPTAVALAAAEGGNSIGVSQRGLGAPTFTILRKLRDSCSIFDYMATPAIDDIISGAQLVDQTAALIDAINKAKAANFSSVYFPDGDYRIDSEVPLLSEMIFASDGGARIHQHTAGNRAMYGNDLSFVELYGLTLIGPGSTTPFTAGSSSGLLDFQGSTRGASRRIKVQDCILQNGHSLIAGVSVDELQLLDNELANWFLYGMLASRSWDFTIRGGSILGSDFTGAGNSYCISATGGGTAGITQERAIISHVHMGDNPSWSAIMSHGVTGLLIDSNVMTNVRTGVDVTTSLTDIKDVIVKGNLITLTTSDQWAGAAALHSGVVAVAQSSAKFEGLVVEGNIIKDWGKMVGSAVSGNVSAPLGGEGLKSANFTGNVVRDVGGEVAGNFAQFYRCDANISLTGNVFAGSPTAYGVRFDNPVGVVTDGIVVEGNRFDFDTAGATSAFYFNGPGTFTGVLIGGNAHNKADKKIAKNNTTVELLGGSDTFQPGITIGGSSTGVTYSTRVGRFTVVDGVCHAEGQIVLTSKGGLTGTVVITGLPKTSSSSGPTARAYQTFPTNLNSMVGNLIASIGQNTSDLTLRILSGTTVSVLDASNILDTFTIAFSVSYAIGA